jgi:hypothetical protein
MNPYAWTYIWYDRKTKKRDQAAFHTVGEALGFAFAGIEDGKVPVEIWHKGWIFYTHERILERYERYKDGVKSGERNGG